MAAERVQIVEIGSATWTYKMRLGPFIITKIGRIPKELVAAPSIYLESIGKYEIVASTQMCTKTLWCSIVSSATFVKKATINQSYKFRL